jgi:diadenosine tetraphosphate (Ap4A) HIT family hydrolase
VASDCLVCRELGGDVAVPGGFLWQDEQAIAFHTPPLEELDHPRPYLGHLLVVTRRHVAPLGELTEEEGAAIAQLLASRGRWSRDVVLSGCTRR